jgi:hypothetical protein
LTAEIVEPTLQTVSDLSEQVAMTRLEQRLHGMYAGLSPERISAVVQDARAQFAQSPVRDFIPLLIERRVRRQLAAMASSSPDDLVAIPG